MGVGTAHRDGAMAMGLPSARSAARLCPVWCRASLPKCSTLRSYFSPGAVLLVTNVLLVPLTACGMGTGTGLVAQGRCCSTPGARVGPVCVVLGHAVLTPCSCPAHAPFARCKTWQLSVAMCRALLLSLEAMLLPAP